ncbi:class I SAM-dependent methyltransferase [Kosmotoga pacifica]|uniref:Methyltransferase type 11 n=1 Tax=Kosmotoga pacifica TaxID=1330330 RepID=A0A0G2ZDQ1_9BACT|nr:class I SAM-dependent methyltransferase [Kosmotoga pacifica]AKI97679.1 methyltransferase type 11 [Kosmotoga pacifica]
MKYKRKKVERTFDSLSEASPIAKRSAECDDIICRVGKKAVELLELSKDDILLDIGTGRGRWALYAAPFCKEVIGIDISSNLLKDAREEAKKRNITNVAFYRGSFENPYEEIDLKGFGINKVISVYAMHHLTDDLKKKAIETLMELTEKPTRIVIADIMWFEDPSKYKESWDEVYYDEGDTDFPANAYYLKKMFERCAKTVNLVKAHPLVGIIVANL